MNATIAALLGSLIGGSAALLGAVFTNIVVLKTESGRRQSEREIAFVRALREHSGTAFAQFFIVLHAIEWITWYGDNDPDVINKRSIKSYENEVHSAYGPLLGAMAMVASLNSNAYEEIRPMLSNLYKLEEQTGKALRDFVAHRSPATTQKLRDCKTETGKILDTLPPELNRIMTLAESTRKRQ